jgi:hypothetical protein
MTATEWLTPAEAARPWPPGAIHASGVDPQHLRCGHRGRADHLPEHSAAWEWRECLEENATGLRSRQLLRVSRLLRNRPAYEERFGTDAYEAMLTGSLWGVDQMIGKLNPALYVLTC